MTKRALIQFRMTHGLTQARLADALRVDVSTVARWEQGRRKIPRWLAASLAALPLSGPGARTTRRRKGGG